MIAAELARFEHTVDLVCLDSASEPFVAKYSIWVHALVTSHRAAGCHNMHAGVSELIEDERNGLIVRAGDAEALAEAPRRLVEQPELCNRWATRLGRRYKVHIPGNRMDSPCSKPLTTA
jgi:glycosyltransferase involved in cell wall biosynthesis